MVEIPTFQEEMRGALHAAHTAVAVRHVQLTQALVACQPREVKRRLFFEPGIQNQGKMVDLMGFNGTYMGFKWI